MPSCSRLQLKIRIQSTSFHFSILMVGAWYCNYLTSRLADVFISLTLTYNYTLIFTLTPFQPFLLFMFSVFSLFFPIVHRFVLWCNFPPFLLCLFFQLLISTFSTSNFLRSFTSAALFFLLKFRFLRLLHDVLMVVLFCGFLIPFGFYENLFAFVPFSLGKKIHFIKMFHLFVDLSHILLLIFFARDLMLMLASLP